MELGARVLDVTAPTPEMACGTWYNSVMPNLIKPRPPGNPARLLLKKVGAWPSIFHNARCRLRVRPWRAAGLSMASCCDRLNRIGHRTFRGRLWTPCRLGQVMAEGRITNVELALALNLKGNAQ